MTREQAIKIAKAIGAIAEATKDIADTANEIMPTDIGQATDIAVKAFVIGKSNEELLAIIKKDDSVIPFLN